MALDIPRVVYGKNNSKPTNAEPKKLHPNDRSIKLQEEANRKARERRKKKEWQKMRLSDLNTQPNTEHNG